jgi:hypothetical protein
MFTPKAQIPPPAVSRITYKQTRGLQDAAMKRGHSYQVQAIVGAMGLAMAAMGFYQVRELVAALLVFSVLFGTLVMALLILFLIQELALKGVTQLEACLACVRARHVSANRLSIEGTQTRRN